MQLWIQSWNFDTLFTLLPRIWKWNADTLEQNQKYKHQDLRENLFYSYKNLSLLGFFVLICHYNSTAVVWKIHVLMYMINKKSTIYDVLLITFFIQICIYFLLFPQDFCFLLYYFCVICHKYVPGDFMIFAFFLCFMFQNFVNV